MTVLAGNPYMGGMALPAPSDYQSSRKSFDEPDDSISCLLSSAIDLIERAPASLAFEAAIVPA
jgi:hypothetical protein